MSEQRKKILITGATGDVGRLLDKALREDYEVVAQGRNPADEEQEKYLQVADIANYDEVLPLMEGVDSVIHLAGAASPESDWDAVLQANIVGMRNVLEAAREEGVRRFIFASSNHAMGGYDREGEWPVYPHQLQRGDSLYGVSKGFGELLGRYYHDEYGIDFLALRIGWVSGDPFLADADILHAMWLSEDDAVQVFRCAIEAEARFGYYYAISDNPNRRWDLTNTMLDLGYRPKDSWTDEPKAPAEEIVEGGEAAPESWPKDS